MLSNAILNKRKRNMQRNRGKMYKIQRSVKFSENEMIDLWSESDEFVSDLCSESEESQSEDKGGSKQLRKRSLKEARKRHDDFCRQFGLKNNCKRHIIRERVKKLIYKIDSEDVRHFLAYSPEVNPDDYVGFVVEKLDGTHDPLSNTLYVREDILEKATTIKSTVNLTHKDALKDLKLRSYKIADESHRLVAYDQIRSTIDELTEKDRYQDEVMLSFMLETGCSPEFLQFLTFEELKDDRTLTYWWVKEEKHKILLLSKRLYAGLQNLREDKRKNEWMIPVEPRCSHAGKEFTGFFIFDRPVDVVWKKFINKFDLEGSSFDVSPIDLLTSVMKFKQNKAL